MLKKLILALALVLLLSQFAVSAALAAEPVGNCAPGFTLMMAMDHDGEHHHQHVGTDTDRNGDGWICMKPVTPTGKIHVHVDNNLP